MAEEELVIVENGQWKNISIRDNLKRGIKGIQDGNHIIVEKRFSEGNENLSAIYKNKDGSPSKSYSCGVVYKGQEVAFWLSEFLHNSYKEVGGEGDKVKISMKEEMSINKFSGVKEIKPVFSFEKVE